MIGLCELNKAKGRYIVRLSSRSMNKQKCDLDQTKLNLPQTNDISRLKY